MASGEDKVIGSQPEDPTQDPGSTDRLDSWKEIAAYLNRDVRTVRRWEKDQGLPVRRHQHQKAASVYAYRSELDQWWKGEEEREARKASGPADSRVQTATDSSVYRSKTHIWIALGLAIFVVSIAALLLSRKMQTTSPSASKPMFAVLPFQNLTGDATQEFVTDGLTEEMITQISEVEGDRLGVIARTSSMAYKGSAKSIKQIGSELGADYVLEGSVRRSGERVRVSAQLIDARTQSHVWAQNFESDRHDILRLQSDIADAIARQIQLVLPGATSSSVVSSQKVDPQVYELCLLGRYEWNKRTNEGLRKAVEYFEQAVARDPGYASAHAGLAEAYLVSVYYSQGSQQEFFSRAAAAAEEAVRLDDRTFNAHAVLGMVASTYWRPGAEREFKRALEINPSYATAHHWYAYYLWRVGRQEESLAEVERARQLDPVSPVINTDEAMFRLAAGQTEDAVRQLRATVELAPDFADAHRSLAVVYAKQKRYEDALVEARKAMDLNPGNMGAKATTGYVYAVSGNREAAGRVLRELKAAAADARPLELWIQIGLGETDQPIEELQREYKEHSSSVAAISLDPIFEPLHGDARFRELVDELKNAH